jgi:serine/threonine-protein kinase
MGEVWAASDVVLGRQVAVKVLRDDLIDSPVFLERFRAEARHTAALAHPGIASVFDYGEQGRDELHVAYLVMELVPGTPLSKMMADRGALPVNTALSLLAQTAEALHAAHQQGVVHRDVKPGNLLVLDDGTIKVTDFGIARAANSAALTEVGQIIGTATYISPEQAIGAEATPSSDVYSLGVIGYEMLAGRPPFTGDSAGALAMAHVHQPPPALPSTVPPAVQAAITEALSKDPADRPSDAHEFATTLRRLQLTMMPPPGTPAIPETDTGEPTLVATNDDTMAATEMMGAQTRTRTAIMPPAAIIGAAADLGMADEPYESRRKRRLIAVAAVSIALALIAVTQLGGADGLQPVNGATTTSTIGAQTIDPNALVGLPVATASERLRALGFVVAVNPVESAGVAGVVSGVAPSGQVPAGAKVTLDVNTPPPAIPDTTVAQHGKKDKKKNDD